MAQRHCLWRPLRVAPPCPPRVAMMWMSMILLGVAGGYTMPPAERATGRCGPRKLWMSLSRGMVGGGGGVVAPAEDSDEPMRLRGGGAGRDGRDDIVVDGSEGNGEVEEESSSSIKSLAEGVSDSDLSGAELREKEDALLRDVGNRALEDNIESGEEEHFDNELANALKQDKAGIIEGMRKLLPEARSERIAGFFDEKIIPYYKEKGMLGDCDVEDSAMRYLSPIKSPSKDAQEILWRLCQDGGSDDDIFRAAKKADVNLPDPSFHNFTALHYAAERGHVAAVEVLIALEAIVNARDDRGLDAALIAEKREHPEVVEALLDAKEIDMAVEGPEGKVDLPPLPSDNSLTEMLLQTSPPAAAVRASMEL